MAQVLRNIFLLGATLTVSACGSSPSFPMPLPVDPQVTVAQFMSAVEANNLNAMGQLWGTKDGLATQKMDRTELQKRLTVMQILLSHDAYELLPSPSTLVVDARTRAYQIRLTRAGCVHNVPVEVIRVEAGWLVSSVDLTQAGNPARSCGRAEPSETAQRWLFRKFE